MAISQDSDDPYQNTQQSSAAPSLKKFFFNSVKTMAMFGIMDQIGMAGWETISRTGAELVKKYDFGPMTKLAREVNAGKIGDILKNTGPGKAVGSFLQSSSKPFTSALQSRESFIKAATARGPISRRIATFTSTFATPVTLAATVGAYWTKHVLGGSVVDNLVNLASGDMFEVNKGDKKKWYDIPGQVGNYARWLAMDTKYSLGFGAATSTLWAAGGAAIGKPVIKAFRGALGRSIVKGLADVKPGMPIGSKVDRAFNKEVFEFAETNYKSHFLSNAMHKAMTFSKTVAPMARSIENTMHEAGQSFKESMVHQDSLAIKAKRTLSDPVRKALSNIKEIWNNNRVHRELYSEASHPGVAALEWAEEVGEQMKSHHFKAHGGVGGLLGEFKALRETHDKTTLMDEIFGLRPLRNRDIVDKQWIKEKHDIFRQHIGKSQSNQLMDSILNMRVSMGHYRAHGSTIKGGGVNLGIFDPKAMLFGAVNAVLLKQYRIPFTNIHFNVGDILGSNTWLTKAPEVAFWNANERRHYKVGKDAADKGVAKGIFPPGGAISTAEATGDPWLTTYINGKLAYFTDAGVQTLDWDRKLMFDYSGGARRRNENAWMRNKMLARIKESRSLPGEAKVNNKWLHQWLDPSQLSFPTVFQGFFNRVTEALQGKNIAYKQVGSILTGKMGGNPNDWYKYADVIQNLRLHAGQDIVHVLKNKEALAIISKANGAAHFGDAHDMMINSRTLKQRIDSRHLNIREWTAWLNNNGLHEETAMLQAYPNQAGKHITVKRMGISHEMTVEDRIRIDEIDDIFSTHWAQQEGMDHPLVRAIPELLKHGYINDAQAKSMRLFSHLNMFKDMGIFGPSFKPRDENFGANLRQVQTRLKSLKVNLEGEITNFIGDRNFRAPSIRDPNTLGAGDLIPRNRSAYVSVAKNKMAFMNEALGSTLDTVSSLMRDTIFPFKKKDEHFGLHGNLKYIAGGTLKIAASIYALKTLDTVIAADPLFDNTALHGGLTGIAADAFATGRLTTSKVLDAVGVTGIAKHLNGLMPGFTTSAPGALIGAVVSRTLGGGPLEMAKMFAYGGIANRMLAPFLPDFTKTYSQLHAEYNGQTEVPIMKSPTWLLGPTPWEGSSVLGYSPNWYVRAKSRWKESDTMYGSVFRKWLHEPIWPLGVSLGDVVDPYYMERKHYFSRPYPKTGAFGEEIPLAGPLIAGTLGRLIKPPKTMHQEFLQGTSGGDSQAEETYPFANPPPTLREGTLMMKHGWNIRGAGSRSTLMGTYQYHDNMEPWAGSMAEDFLYNVQNFAGLKGFLGGSIVGKIFKGPRVLPTLETAGRIASQSRSYTDSNVGGLGIFTEPVRRLIQKPDSSRYGINPIPNMMPDWLPAEYMTGDPFAKIVRGELRLPGAAYTKTHPDTRRSMPARASMLGAPVAHQLQYFTGLLSPMLKEEYDIMGAGTTMHAQIQDSLAAEGLLVQAEVLVYDVKRDISGHVDAIIKDGYGGKGRRALEIKTVNSQGFAKLDGPKNEHVSQLNFYLKQLGLYKGTFLYINRDNPSQVKTYEISYNKSRYQRDMEKLDKSRQLAKDMTAEGVRDRYGYDYSWLDRMKILADVAPTSKEFKEAKVLVQDQIKANILTAPEITEYKTALKHRQARIRKYELYPLRFKSKILSPDTQANIQSINDDIKSGDQYSLPERVVGAAWETFTNSNNFLTNKFFAFKDPLEHYKTLRLYGKEYKPWDTPVRSFAAPYVRGALAQDNPIGGAYKFAVAGQALFGPVGSLIAGSLGALYGTVNGAIRTASNSVYIPNQVKDQREINQYFDQVKFERFSRAAQLSEGLTRKEYQDAASTTLTAFNQGGENVANLFRGTGYMEKPYIGGWLGETDPSRRKEILKFIPSDLGKALKKEWGKADNKASTGGFIKNSADELAAGYNGPKFNRSLLDPSVNLEDIKLKTIEDEGYNAHDFGLGWNEQMLRMQEDYNDIQGAKVEKLSPDIVDNSTDLSPSHIKYGIVENLRNMGISCRAEVYINEGADDVNSVNVFVKRDRANAIVNALTNRSKYLG